MHMEEPSRTRICRERQEREARKAERGHTEAGCRIAPGSVQSETAGQICERLGDGIRIRDLLRGRVRQESASESHREAGCARNRHPNRIARPGAPGTGIRIASQDGCARNEAEYKEEKCSG